MSIKNILNNATKIMSTNNYKHYKNYKTFDNFYILTIKCIIWAILGLIIGIIINDSVIYISNKLKIKNKFIQIIIQILFCSIIVAFLHTYHKFIGWTIHNTIPGILFIALLFNVQLKLINNIQSSYIINNDNDYNINKNRK